MNPGAGPDARAAGGRRLGYCTNVHAGETFAETRDNLRRFALAVKARVSPAEPLGVGLWLSARAARTLRDDGGVDDFAAWLEERGLDVFTMNGFPAGDFHREVVKHDVYRPDWRSPERAAYTADLAHVLAALRRRRGDDREGSISTLPLGWGASFRRAMDRRQAAEALRETAVVLARIESETGVLLHVDLEPEPGCALGRLAEVPAFFREHLLDGPDDAVVRRHLRVCHDVCHAAVMFEDQAAALAALDDAGVSVGKVQVSSALSAPFHALAGSARRGAWRQLAAFREPRYLHQTMRRSAGAGGADTFVDDLVRAIARQGPDDPPDDEWRVHFHVPIFLEAVGHLRTTRREIETALRLFADRPAVRHFEIETYAWNVLPPSLASDDLVDGIAREIEWLRGEAPPGMFDATPA